MLAGEEEVAASAFSGVGEEAGSVAAAITRSRRCRRLLMLRGRLSSRYKLIRREGKLGNDRIGGERDGEGSLQKWSGERGA